MSVSIAMVLLQREMQISAADVGRELHNRYPELEASLTDDGGNTASFELKNGQMILGSMPAPVPWTDLEGPCATSILWRNAAEEVRAHQAHIIVTVAGALEPIESSILLTQCTAAVLAATDVAIGVYWGNATLVVPRNIFLEFTEKVLPLGPPLDIWVDFRVGWKTSKTSAGFTQGLEALGHIEMETLEAPEEPAKLRQRLQDLASYLLRKGAVVRDGDTVGQNASEKIRVVYGESSFGHSRQVMRLQYQLSPKRPWWKLI